MSKLVEFPKEARQRPGSEPRKIVYVDHCIVPGMGWKRPRWIVVVIFANGSSEWRDGPTDKPTAELVAGVLSRKYGYPIVPREELEPAQEPVPLTLLQAMRAALYETLPTPEGCAYRRSLGVDDATLAADGGCLVVAPVRYFPHRSFDLLEEDETGGVASAIVEVLDSDRETVVDLVAWPLHRPEKFATALRRADALGLNAVTNPSTYFAGGVLRVHRTPKAWLRSWCQGCVILDELSSPRWLGAAPGPIATEDVAHAREVARLLHPFTEPSRILAPRRAA